MTTSLERRIKRWVHAPAHDVWILGPSGITDACAEEARTVCESFLHRQREMPQISDAEAGVRLRGVDFRNLLQLGFEMKTARDILWRVHTARTPNRSALGRGLEAVDWDVLVPRGAEIACRATSRRSSVYHEGLVGDVFAEVVAARGLRPSAKGTAQYLVDLRLDRDELTVFLSLAGGDHYRRGFKKALMSKASVKEDLAAAATWWAAPQNARPDAILVPFAGSGTLGFEAALRFHRMPLSALPRRFAFERFPCTPSSTLRYVKEKLDALMRDTPAPRLHFLEKDPEQAAGLEVNAGAFPLASTVSTGDVFTADAAWMGEPTGHAFIPLNPPYGLRLGDTAETIALYRNLGAWVSALKWPSLSGYVLAPDDDTAASFLSTLHGIEHEGREVRHGGRKTSLIRFRRP